MSYNKPIHLILIILSFIACKPKNSTPTGFGITKAVKVFNEFDKFKTLLEKQNDTLYVVNFWATWCKPCIEELPYFEELGSKYKNSKIKVLLVSLDFVGKTEKVEAFVEKRKIQSEVVHLSDANNSEWIDKVHKTWSGSIPATYVYQNNKVAFYEQSFESLEELETVLNGFNF